MRPAFAVAVPARAAELRHAQRWRSSSPPPAVAAAARDGRGVLRDASGPLVVFIHLDRAHTPLYGRSPSRSGQRSQARGHRLGGYAVAAAELAPLLMLHPAGDL